ncbi:MAG: flagellar motor protein MotB [Thermoanaerobaculia bacterium]
MIGPRDTSLADDGGTVSFWPGLIDLVTSALMVFLLLSFIQTVLNVDQIEAVVTQAQQARFLQEFEKAFRRELEAETVSVDRHVNYLQITFSDRVLFVSADHRLQARGREMLRRCARLFGQAGSSGYRQIQVEGHTDSLPLRRETYPRDNWELSTARALSVVRFLRAAGGVPEGTLSANGYADQRPVASNETAAGRAENRRIEIRLFFALAREDRTVGAGSVP